MASSSIFTGIGLWVLSAIHSTNNTITVTFSIDPLQASPSGLNDALNPANWTLTGPGVAGIQSVALHSDAKSVILTPSGLLNPGIWTITAGDSIQTASGSAVVAPKSTTFEAKTTQASTNTQGVENDDSESIIRKHLNPTFAGPGWAALIAALSSGDRKTNQNAEAAFNQLFLSTASGVYLDRLASNSGIVRPTNIGFTDEDFRALVISLLTSKVTLNSVLSVLDVFYGAEYVRAQIATAGSGPYAIRDQDDLKILVDGIEYVVRFESNQFRTISAATTVEVVNALNYKFSIHKAPIVARSSSSGGVILFTESMGLRGSVAVVGGLAQSALKFSTELEVY